MCGTVGPMSTMTNATRIRDGINIILARDPAALADIHGGALYAGPDKIPLTIADCEALYALGWHEDEDSWAVET